VPPGDDLLQLKEIPSLREARVEAALKQLAIFNGGAPSDTNGGVCVLAMILLAPFFPAMPRKAASSSSVIATTPPPNR
jgi:hypothetical protein